MRLQQAMGLMPVFFVLALSGPVLVPATAGAGWIIEERDADFPSAGRTYYIEGDQVRVEGFLGDTVFLLSLGDRKGYLLDVKAGRYAGGRLDDVKKALLAHETERLEEERKGNKAAPSSGEERSAAVLSPVRIEPVMGIEMIAGHDTEHYRLLLEEELIEELWIAPKLKILPKGEGSTLDEMLEELSGRSALTGGEYPIPYERQADYLDLLERGFPLRRIKYFIGEKILLEVHTVREETLSPALFSIPEGLKVVSYPTLFFGLD